MKIGEETIKTTWAMVLLTGLIVALAAPAEAGLVAYWNFNEGIGTTVADFSANHNSGTINGSLTWVAGRTGNAGDYALSFPGNDANYVGVPDSTSLHINSKANKRFTIAAWVYDEGSSWGNWYCQGTTTTRCLCVQTDNNGSDSHYIWSDSTGPKLVFGATTTKNVWHHLAVTCDGTTIRTYIDGVAKNTGAANAGLTAWGTLFIGRASRAISQAVNGYIDDVVVFDSVEDVVQIMNGTHPAMRSSTPGTLIYGK